MEEVKKRICYIPGRESGYSRNRVLLKSLRDAGFVVYDCSSPVRHCGRYVFSFWKFLRCKGECDIILVGFLGQFLMPFVRIFSRKPVVFDAFLSVYQTMVFDRCIFRENGLFAKFAKLVDKYSCQLADRVILDTNEHIAYFVSSFQLDRNKFFRVPIGTDESIIFPSQSSVGEKGKFRVHFHGEFQELHGTDYIIEAARLLTDVQFRMIGKGPKFTSSREFAKREGIRNIEFMDVVPYETLKTYMEEADVCLGIFGVSQKTQLVVPHKVYEAVACGRPVITGDTKAIKEFFSHGEDVYLCSVGNAERLAGAIKDLRRNDFLRNKISENALNTYVQKCSNSVIGSQLGVIFKELSSFIKNNQ